MEHIRQRWRMAAASQSTARFVHLFLPPDPDEAHRALAYVHLSRLARRVTAAEATEYDHARLHDLIAHEGFSHHPVHGTPPATGYMASYDAPEGSGQAVVHHISAITPEHIATHREAIAHHLAKPDSYQGGWHDTADGNVYLDASRHFHDEGECRGHCVREQQKAYFRLDDFSDRYVHPKLDPLALKDPKAWQERYAEHGQDPPEGYGSYVHRYPATDEQREHWAQRGHHLASAGKGRMAGWPVGPWRSEAWVEQRHGPSR